MIGRTENGMTTRDECRHAAGDGCMWCCIRCDENLHRCNGCGTDSDHRDTTCDSCAVLYAEDVPERVDPWAIRTAQPFDTDPSVIDHPVFRYSEWLDSQGLMRGDNEGDARSHARLAADFLAQDAKTRADDEQAARIKRGAAELGRIVASQNADALAAIGNSDDLIDEDGDGDWAVVWERLAELRPERDAALAALDTAKYDADWLTEKNAELLDAVVDLIAQRDRARDIAVALEQELAEVKGQTLGYLMIERYENSTLMDVIDDDGDGSSVRPMGAPPSFSEVPDGYVVVALVGQA